MDAFIEALTPEVIGKPLGINLYSRKGSLLLRRGTEITPTHYSHLKDVGYKSVYLQDDNNENLNSNGLLISEKLRAKAPKIIMEIFERLLSDKRDELAQAKKDLNRLIETLLNEINYKLDKRFKILDLKRGGDYLYQHALNVASYSILIGHRLQYHQLKLVDLATAALLHDFGKQFISKEILEKETPLNEQEKYELRQHPIQGFKYLGRQCQFKATITVVAMQHHEHYDGSGYPNGISGSEIHEYSRIVAVANFFDVYTSDRPWRRLHSITDAVQYINSQRGKAFDSQIADHFLSFFA